MNPNYPFVDSLPSGSLDIVGDVHGEIEPLKQLLTALGYDVNGGHAAGRALVFLGDLGDRGPDSPAVYALVDRLWQAGRALCVLGNHELDLLREDAKDGNGWAFSTNHDRVRHRYVQSQDAGESERVAIREFIARLPLALEREDLRVVHACWDEPSIAKLRNCAGTAVAEAFVHFDTVAARSIQSPELVQRMDAERQAYDLTDRTVVPPMLEGVGRVTEWLQMENPLRVTTSGAERYGTEPYFSSGRWRMTNRVAWWDGYRDHVPVVFGHYWRSFGASDRSAFGKHGPDLFGATAPLDWLGPRKSAFCVDFSVGFRHRERELGEIHGKYGRLAALRWPERELIFDNGDRLPTTVRQDD